MKSASNMAYNKQHPVHQKLLMLDCIYRRVGRKAFVHSGHVPSSEEAFGFLGH